MRLSPADPKVIYRNCKGRFTAEGSYRQPMLIDQLEYLWGMTTRADQRPGADARARRDALHEALERIVDEFEGLGR